MPGNVPAATKTPARESGWSKASRMSGMAGPTRVLARIPVTVIEKISGSGGGLTVVTSSPSGPAEVAPDRVLGP